MLHGGLAPSELGGGEFADSISASPTRKNRPYARALSRSISGSRVS